MRKNIVTQLFRKQKGYAHTSELLAKGVSFRDIKRLVEENQLFQVKRGLYRLQDDEHTSLRDFVDVCRAIPKAVICLYSALASYELTTFVPTEIMIAVPQGYRTPKLAYPPLQIFHFSKKQYEAGIEERQDKMGNYRIYSPEKSVCDAFRFRRKLGDDVAKEALFDYLKRKDRDLKKLLEYAEICRMTAIMKPYIEARLG